MPFIYDTTLRDGSQQEGVNFSLEDKINIIRELDDLQVDYIEVGWPGSNPIDTELLQHPPKTQHAKLVAFGRTSRSKDDPLLHALINSCTSYVCIFGKTWDRHVTDVLETTLEHNLDMIYNTITYLRSHHKHVFFDAEHFFDGYKHNRDYALQCLKKAEEAGAECIILCDTNGGTMTEELLVAYQDTYVHLNAPLGIHLHNDRELAVANSCLVASLDRNVVIQGTINGIGERIGNANLTSIIPNLVLGHRMVVNCKLQQLKHVSDYVANVCNIGNDNMPYVGCKAFTHKAGVHASAVIKWPGSYEHVDPELVGNQRYLPLSSSSGRNIVKYYAQQLGYSNEHIEQRLDAMMHDLKERDKIDDINKWIMRWMSI